eukprot:gene15592-biopygen6693
MIGGQISLKKLRGRIRAAGQFFPGLLTVRGDVLGASIGEPIRGDVLWAAAGQPVRGDVLGTSVGEPVRGDVLGASIGQPVRGDVLGASAGVPERGDVLWASAGEPKNWPSSLSFSSCRNKSHGETEQVSLGDSMELAVGYELDSKLTESSPECVQDLVPIASVDIHMARPEQ